MEIFNSTIHFRYDSFGAAANGTKSDLRNVGRGNGENRAMEKIREEKHERRHDEERQRRRAGHEEELQSDE